MNVWVIYGKHNGKEIYFLEKEFEKALKIAHKIAIDNGYKEWKVDFYGDGSCVDSLVDVGYDSREKSHSYYDIKTGNEIVLYLGCMY